MNTPPDDTFWHSPPAESERAWLAIFAASRDLLDLAAPCPVCAAQTLHHWYDLQRPDDKIIDGKHFIGLGGLWEWCSRCGSYQHYSALVPDWWVCELEVPHGELTALPTAIEAARRSREKQ